MFMIPKLLQHIAMWRRLRGDERGATAVEYGIMVALIAAVIVATVALVGEDVLEAFTDVEEELPDPD